MVTLIAVRRWSCTSIRLARGSGWLVRAAGIVTVVLVLSSADQAWSAMGSLTADGCEQSSTTRSPVAVPVVSQAIWASTAVQKPAQKGAANMPDGAKQKSVPPAAKEQSPKAPAPKEPATKEPAAKEPAAKEPAAKEPANEGPETKKVAPPAEPAATDEAAKAAAEVTAAAGDEDVGEGPDVLAQKFAELLEKRRAEAAAEATAKKGVPNPAAKVSAPKPAPPAELTPVPAPAATPTPEPVDKPAPEATEVEAVPAPAAPVNEGPPTIDVLVLQTADALADVPRTERIGQLILTGGNLTNRSMRSLEGLAVSELSIEAIRVSNTGIQYVRSVQGVRRLRLWTPEVDDTGVSHLAGLQSLEVLDIEGTSIQGSGLAQLKGLANLTTLIMGPKATDSQLVALQELPALSQLDLRACPNLTLACLDTLAQLKNLKTVWLPSHIRAKGKRVLSEALPACEVRS